jgi:hypothetical protein
MTASIATNPGKYLFQLYMIHLHGSHPVHVDSGGFLSAQTERRGERTPFIESPTRQYVFCFA